MMDTLLCLTPKIEQNSKTGKRCHDQCPALRLIPYNHIAKGVIPIRPERRAQLEEFARQQGTSPADALDEALATYLELQRQDFEEAVEGIREGYADMQAGRTQLAHEALEELRLKHGLRR